MTSGAAPIDVAVIGVGRMGKRHAQAYRRIAAANLVAVVDGDEERAETVADELNCKAFTSVDALLKAFPKLHAVTVAVPTNRHLPTAWPLIDRGIACLVEKPLAPTADDARKLTEHATRQGVVLQVGHTERFNPAVQAVAAMDFIPRFIEVDRVSPMTFRSLDVGVVMDIMIHDLDIVLMLARSPLQSVAATGVAVLGEHEDVANARLVFENGCVANLTASRLALKTERKLRVFSENAYVSLNYHTRTGQVIRKAENEAALTRLREQIAAGEDLSNLDYSDVITVQDLTMGPAAESADQLTAQLNSFIDAVRDGSTPAVDGAAGYAAVDAAERVVRAIHEHRWEGLSQPRL